MRRWIPDGGGTADPAHDFASSEDQTDTGAVHEGDIMEVEGENGGLKLRDSGINFLTDGADAMVVEFTAEQCDELCVFGLQGNGHEGSPPQG